LSRIWIFISVTSNTKRNKPGETRKSVQDLSFSPHTVILPVVLNGCETWSPILKNEYKFVFENRVLRRNLGPKREEEAGD